MKNGVYPVGYSVMPIYKESTVSIGGVLEKKESIVAYMPSKCYVVSTERKILKNGTVSNSYGVVFPYETGKTVAESYFTSNYPKYNKEDECINSYKTTFLTDGYEVAYQEAERLNEKILANTVYSKASNNILFKNEKRHNALVKAYMSGADFIENRTKDTLITVDDNLVTTKKVTNNKVLVLK